MYPFNRYLVLTDHVNKRIGRKLVEIEIKNGGAIDINAIGEEENVADKIEEIQVEGGFL